jgi:hypothetical protein
MFFGKKDLKKDNSLKCQVNTLTCYMSFGPLCTKNGGMSLGNGHYYFCFEVLILHENGKKLKSHLDSWFLVLNLNPISII